MTTLDQLQSLLTQWDIKQSKKRGYNPYALGIYFEAAERAAIKDLNPCSFEDGKPYKGSWKKELTKIGFRLPKQDKN